MRGSVQSCCHSLSPPHTRRCATRDRAAAEDARARINAESLSWVNSWQHLKQLNHEILGLRMMHHNRIGALLRLQMELFGQVNTNTFLRLEQIEYLTLVFQVRARRIAKRVS